MPERKVIYLKHPVSPDEKTKLIAQGYKILDERFKPEGLAKESASGTKTQSVTEKPKPIRRRTRKSNNAN